MTNFAISFTLLGLAVCPHFSNNMRNVNIIKGILIHNLILSYNKNATFNEQYISFMHFQVCATK